MTGPPTPPATSPVELQDQARLKQAQRSVSSQVVPETRPDIYQNALPSIVDCIQKNDYEKLVSTIEELDFITGSNQQLSRLLVVIPLVLGHLVLDDTPAARYALLKLPDNLLAHPLSGSLLPLISATANRNHVRVYDQARGILNLVEQATFPDSNLASIIIAMIAAFLEAFRRRTFELLSKAYTSLPLHLACSYLDWSKEEVVTVAGNEGWSYEPSTEILSPKASSSVVMRTANLSNSSTLDTFHKVIGSVARLEI